MIASDFAAGVGVHSSGGEIFIPRQVYWRGISSPSLNAVLVTFICGEAAWRVGPEGAAWLATGAGCRAQADAIRQSTANVQMNFTMQFIIRYLPAATMRSMIFGSLGSKPDFGNRGVSSIQLRSIANTRLKSGSDSSTRPMLTRATACQ